MAGAMTVKGVVRGKTIELEQSPGLPDGQEVMVTVQASTNDAAQDAARGAGEGIRRSAGAWADDVDGLEQYLEWSRQQRKHPPAEAGAVSFLIDTDICSAHLKQKGQVSNRSTGSPRGSPLRRLAATIHSVAGGTAGTMGAEQSPYDDRNYFPAAGREGVGGGRGGQGGAFVGRVPGAADPLAGGPPG